MSNDPSTPPIHLKTALQEPLESVQLERYVTVAGNDIRRRARCPIITDEIDPEMACRVFHEFTDISGVSRLSLTTGPLKFEFWRQCLGGQARSHWDSIVPDLGGNTNNDFSDGIAIWFTKYMEPTAYHQQKQYFLNTSKAYSMSVKSTASRIKTIVTFMQYMPGSPDTVAEIYSATELKMCLYRLMRLDWKTSFDASGNDITEDAYSWERLVTYMSAQERKEVARRGGGRSSNSRGGRGFAGRSRGGRGFHRGSNYQSGGRYSGYMRPYYSYQQGGSAPQRPRYNSYGQSYSSGAQVTPQRQGYLPGTPGRTPFRSGGRFPPGRGGRSSGFRGGGRFGRGGFQARGRGGPYQRAPPDMPTYAVDTANETPPPADNPVQEQPPDVASMPSPVSYDQDYYGDHYYEEHVPQEHWMEDMYGAFDGYDDAEYYGEY